MDDMRTGREAAIVRWLEQLGVRGAELRPVSHDASFRRYFRVATAQGSRVIMDAPPDKENVDAFIDVAGLLTQADVRVPRILAREQAQGFLLMDDLGDRRYLDELDAASADRLYHDALQCLQRMQLRLDVRDARLPVYDEAMLRRELGLFRSWFLERLLGMDSPELDRLLPEVENWLVEAALSQPQVFVHRDFHSRNLMHLADDNPGVLDFQDAVLGPITYDLVSLLRDCYVQWPPQRVLNWALFHHQSLIQAGLTLPGDDLFLRWFDLMGMQRHLKAIGIFSRLLIRDGQPGYLPDIPRTLFYVRQVCHRHAGFSRFGHYLDRHVVPLMNQARFQR